MTQTGACQANTLGFNFKGSTWEISILLKVGNPKVNLKWSLKNTIEKNDGPCNLSQSNLHKVSYEVGLLKGIDRSRVNLRHKAATFQSIIFFHEFFGIWSQFYKITVFHKKKVESNFGSERAPSGGVLPVNGPLGKGIFLCRKFLTFEKAYWFTESEIDIFQKIWIFKWSPFEICKRLKYFKMFVLFDFLIIFFVTLVFSLLFHNTNNFLIYIL